MSDQVPLVKFDCISKHFPGVTALDRVSFDVHMGEIVAIVGENGAGKSTLANILSGVLQPDEGSIVFQGETTQISNPNESQKLGIKAVYQEMSLCPNLSIAENISLINVGSQSDLDFVDRKNINEHAQEILSKLTMNIENLDTLVRDISIAHQQLVEIAKAISTKAKLVIFDEPTSALTEEDTKQLFKIIRDLKSNNISVIYVTHRFEEVVSLADRVVVLRDGNLIDILNIDDVTVEILIEKVAGHAIDDLYRGKAKNIAMPEIGLEIRKISDKRKIKDISFQVNKGMVLGIAGLADSGKSELGESLFGLRKSKGEILIDGRIVEINSPMDALRNGLAYVPANRRAAGVLGNMSVRDNIVISIINSLNRLGFLNFKGLLVVAKKFVQSLGIKITNLSQKITTISGGNQQKIILSRCLATNPSILLLDEPTRGIDVGFKAEIYKILEELAQQNVTIVIISSELTELMSQCNQIIVMYNGKIQGKFTQEEFEEKEIVSCLMGEAVCL